MVPSVQVSERAFRLADELSTRVAAKQGYEWQCWTRKRRREKAVDPPVGVNNVKWTSTRRLTRSWALEISLNRLRPGLYPKGVLYVRIPTCPVYSPTPSPAIARLQQLNGLQVPGRVKPPVHCRPGVSRKSSSTRFHIQTPPRQAKLLHLAFARSAAECCVNITRQRMPPAKSWHIPGKSCPRQEMSMSTLPPLPVCPRSVSALP